MKWKPSKRELLISLPSILWMIIFFLIPSIVIYAYAFKPADIYGGIGEGWTLQTIAGLGNSIYLKLLFRTLWLSALTTFFALCLALPVGYQLVTISKKWRNLLLMLIIVPFWSSLLIRIFAWKTLLHPEGILHQSLEFFGIISENTTLLYNATAVLFVMVYTFLPFAVLPIYAAASKFNLRLMEAAMDLGATRSQAFFRVFIPGIEKGIATAALMVFIPAVGTYVIPDLVGGTNSEMIGNKIAQKTFIERNLPQASALSAFLAVVVLGILLIIKRHVGSHRKIRIYDEVRNRE
jgi:spermidine/putrescine transport system permease protein